MSRFVFYFTSAKVKIPPDSQRQNKNDDIDFFNSFDDRCTIVIVKRKKSYRRNRTSQQIGSSESDQVHLAKMTLAELENAYICRIMEITQGNKVKAAKILGIDRGTLYRKLGDDQI